MEYVKLNNGVKMPILGYGVYQTPPEETERCILEALETGYRSIDTAQAYYNEEGVGNALAKCGIPREEIFITTKVWISNAGYEKAKESIRESLRKLQTDYVDLLLIHQPFGDYYGTYRAMEEVIRKERRVRSACRISTRTGIWTCSISLRSNRRSTRWRLMCSSSRRRHGNIWRNTAPRSCHGGRLPRVRTIISRIRC